MYVDKVFCEECGTEVSENRPVTDCPQCGEPLRIDYDLERIGKEIDRDQIENRKGDLFRYRELLPLKEAPVTLGEGDTPVIESSALGPEADLAVHFKLEYCNPTGSFKDRGVAMTVSKAREWGVEKVADDSSGNAGAALAAYSARAGLDCTIYVPEKASGEKIEQVKSYGAELRTVPGPRKNTAEKIREETEESSVHYASHNLSPYFTEGMKTIAYEVSEYFDWNPPEHVVFPVGGGALLVGVYRGFRDLLRLGWIGELPAIYGVQSKACDPVVRAFEASREDIEPVDVEPTIAEGIHIGNPERGREILTAIRDTGGRALAVAEAEIRRTHKSLAEREGIYAEPTSATPIAGLPELSRRGVIGSGDRVLVPITGFGLKDVRVGERN